MGTAIARSLIIWFACIGVLVLSGCAATGERFSGLRPPSSGDAQIVLYRPDLFRAGGSSLKVYVDDRELGVLRNAGWLASRVDPGERSITIDQRFEFGKKTSMPIVAKAGETAVIRVLPGGMTGVFVLPVAPVVTFGPWTMQQVTQEVAEAEMKDLKRSE